VWGEKKRDFTTTWKSPSRGIFIGMRHPPSMGRQGAEKKLPLDIKDLQF